MFCPRCGTENKQESAFCRNCGQPLSLGGDITPPASSPRQDSAVLKKSLSSPWYLIGTIAMTAAAAWSLFGLFMSYALIPFLSFLSQNGAIPHSVLEFLREAVPSWYYAWQSNADPFVIVFSLLLSLSAFGICAAKALGHWFNVAASRRAAHLSMNTRGLTVLKAALIMQTCYTAISVSYSTFYNIYNLIHTIAMGYHTTWIVYGIHSSLPVLFIIYLLQRLIGAVILIISDVMLIRLIGEAKNTLRTGQPIRHIPMFIGVALCILSFFSLLDFSFFHVIACACFAVAFFLFRRRMRV